MTTSLPDYRLHEAQRPKRCYMLRLHIGGDSWEDVIRSLREAEEHISECGPGCQMASGGVSAGYFVEVEHHPEMTSEKYHEALDAYQAFRRLQFPVVSSAPNLGSGLP